MRINICMPRNCHFSRAFLFHWIEDVVALVVFFLPLFHFVDGGGEREYEKTISLIHGHSIYFRGYSELLRIRNRLCAYARVCLLRPAVRTRVCVFYLEFLSERPLFLP